MAQPTAAGILDRVRVRPLLFAAFIVVPLVEIALFIAVGRAIGFWWTLGIVIVTAFIGSYFVSRQGRETWLAVRAEFAAGAFPGRSLVHGAMILVAGALLLTPGFLTDGVGFLLLVPAVREWLRLRVVNRYRNRWTVVP